MSRLRNFWLIKSSILNLFVEKIVSEINQVINIIIYKFYIKNTLMVLYILIFLTN